MATATASPAGESPVYLLAAAYSAVRSGDRELERVARKRLADEYGIRLTFHAPKAESKPKRARA